MSGNGSITFGDIAGTLAMLRVACAKCGRDGRYRVDRLLAEHGRDGRLVDWLDALTADCPRRNAPGIYDRCQAKMPDLWAAVARGEERR